MHVSVSLCVCVYVRVRICLHVKLRSFSLIASREKWFPSFAGAVNEEQLCPMHFSASQSTPTTWKWKKLWKGRTEDKNEIRNARKSTAEGCIKTLTSLCSWPSHWTRSLPRKSSEHLQGYTYDIKGSSLCACVSVTQLQNSYLIPQMSFFTDKSWGFKSSVSSKKRFVHNTYFAMHKKFQMCKQGYYVDAVCIVCKWFEY